MEKRKCQGRRIYMKRSTSNEIFINYDLIEFVVRIKRKMAASVCKSNIDCIPGKLFDFIIFYLR